MLTIVEVACIICHLYEAPILDVPCNYLAGDVEVCDAAD